MRLAQMSMFSLLAVVALPSITLIGAFKNMGRAWSQEAEAVNVHDFLSAALGRAVPYGIYDVTHQRGAVYVGSSGDTAQFAVDAIAQWWQTQERHEHAHRGKPHGGHDL